MSSGERQTFLSVLLKKGVFPRRGFPPESASVFTQHTDNKKQSVISRAPPLHQRAWGTKQQPATTEAYKD